MEENLYITDLVDFEILQRMQNLFTKMTGIEALVTDSKGVTLTKSGCDFCAKLMLESEEGRKRCRECYLGGAELTLEKGVPVVHTCHAGLLSVSAPIMENDEQLAGCFIAGQVMTKKPDDSLITNAAEITGADFETCKELLEKVSIVTEERMNRGVEFLQAISEVLSDIAYSKLLTYQASQDIARVANMKSDFLANMSHEIRTPMNAVIGMAEMALREELSPAARDYINQIKSSGKALLTIINDILDFSKIDSGKMDINIGEYEPMSIISDISNIILTRIGEKDVELILDIAPNIPNVLLGDNIRIKQIIINIANNAVKFTQEGRVLVKMDYERVSEDKLDLLVSVKDTGIGIKKEDVGKLFRSFQQVDSKRNRNIEGTGLGLAISKRLLQLMGGDIHVESEYGKGSTFSFHIPQKIVDDQPSITIKEKRAATVINFMGNPYISRQLKKDSRRLKAAYYYLDSEEDLDSLKEIENEIFLFVDHVNFTSAVEKFVKDNPEILAVLLVGFNVLVEYPIPNLLIMKKPIYTLNLAMILNHEDIHLSLDNEDDGIDFIAPDARVLIVDDNAINLTVAEGLLEPLKMKIDTVLSGKEAIGKISVCKYDVILMDHMMPELDGVETTHIIRRFHLEYADIPIIALTANAVEGTREMFMKEGMNDFVAKPIELRILASKMKQWLPADKIKKVSAEEYSAIQKEQEQKETIPPIADLDIEYSMKLLGSEKLFWNVLRDYYRVIEKKAELLKELEQKENWDNYTIEAHALKSASKQIGAMALSDLAATMEKAGIDKDGEAIHSHTDDMLEKYRSYLPILEGYFQEEEEEEDDDVRAAITDEVQNRLFADMRDALENLDMDRMEEVAEEMRRYRYQDWECELLQRLYDAVEEMDVDACEGILSEWEDH